MGAADQDDDDHHHHLLRPPPPLPPSPLLDLAAHPLHPGQLPLTSFANTIQNVCSIAFLLGFLFALNLLLLFLSPNSSWTRLHLYFILLILFHLLEFLITAIFNPSRVSVDSFLLNNGSSYWLAQLFCTTEYILKQSYPAHPSILLLTSIESSFVHRLGLGLVILGQSIRTLSMITAANSFNHRVSTRSKKRADHTLVTHGIYRYCRHPAYLAFFWWSLGIQLLLGNSVSFVLFSAILWNFFNSRIHTEEYHLVKYFNQAYLDYRSNTPTYIPFIR